jgi:hypothetical protein
MKSLGELAGEIAEADAAKDMDKALGVDEVAEAVMTLAKELPVFVKDTKGQAGGGTYKYFTLDQIMHKLRPVLSQHNFVLSHTTEYDGPGCYSFVTQLWLGGEVVREARCPFTPHPDPQKLGSQVTYYRRYTICMLFAIVADKDDDGAAAMEPAADQAPAIDELSLRGDVASMSEVGQQLLRDELIAHAEKHQVSMSQVGELIKETAEGKTKLSDLTTGQVNSLFCEIEDRSKGS